MAEFLDTSIYVLMTVADWRPEETTPLAGFSLSLGNAHGLMRVAASLPSSIIEFSGVNHPHLFSRRMCGVSPINFHPQSPRAILSQPVPVETPFTLVMLGVDQKAVDYKQWAQSCPIPPTIVSDQGGDLGYADLSLGGLQRHFLTICDLLPKHFDADTVKVARNAIEDWKPLPGRTLPYKIGGHATISPNVVALMVAGYESPVENGFDVLGEGVQPYVDQIVLTTRSVRALQNEVPYTFGEASFPRRPSLTLFAPAMFENLDRLTPKAGLGRDEKRRFQLVKNALTRQAGYSYETRTQAQMEALFGRTGEELEADGGNINPHWLMLLRQRELAAATGVAELLAASELSAVIRLPNAVNLSAGAVRQFAAHYRANSRSGHRSLEVFQSLQKRLAEAVPPDLLQLISDASGDIRIVADAPLEWLDLDGLPLCVRRNVSRIAATPGNLFVEQMTAKPIIRLTPSEFRKVLVISALKRGDQIRGLFEQAFTEYSQHWKDEIDVTFVEVGSADELVTALNSFDGAIAIFDGHGSHAPGQPAALHLKDEACDVWSLRGRIERLPPIMILSACDTHAADRNHATTANGFLALGSRAVLGSFFPLEAVSAAIFAARLVYRVAQFVPATVGLLDRALTWTEIVSGMLRMQLLTDLLHALRNRNLIDSDQYREIGSKGNFAINGGAEDPFAEIVKICASLGLNEAEVERELQMAVARSSSISYLNMGRPETILFDTDRRLERVENDLAALGVEDS